MLPVIFKEPWWWILFHRKVAWIFLLVGTIVVHVINTTLPLLLSWILRQGASSTFFLGIGVLVWCLVIEPTRFLIYYMQYVLGKQIEYSIACHAYTTLMTVDPIYHVGKTTGRSFGKFERSIRASEDFITCFMYDLFPIGIQIGTACASLLAIGTKLGIIFILFLVTLTALNVVVIMANAWLFEPRILEAMDNVNSLGLEGVVQINHVRAAFATNEWLSQVKRASKISTNTMIMHVMVYLFCAFSTQLLYVASVCFLTWTVIGLIQSDAMTFASGLALIATYIYGTSNIAKIGERTKKCTQAYIRVQNLYNFVASFGMQSFPVTYDNKAKAYQQVMPIETLTLVANNLSFGYDSRPPILYNHSVEIEALRSQTNKLYGIIGPSGVGKTTLLSILGGQLKPASGNVLVNGVSLYDINDHQRRQLIALQGQVAASITGTVRHNLLLGMVDKDHAYSDAYLIDVLHKVGLWPLFEQQNGLECRLGEYGVGLSIGQRQRLNFAAIYLRACYFKPSLILIDEPTSSLDLISEKAITQMMNDLACHAITIVIAHRLDTLQKATGILDFSLANRQKELLFYTREELALYSDYYQKLVKGEEPIDV
jgi:ABC-type multidrug transport system fused ATPase/permease subunit